MSNKKIITIKINNSCLKKWETKSGTYYNVATNVPKTISSTGSVYFNVPARFVKPIDDDHNYSTIFLGIPEYEREVSVKKKGSFIKISMTNEDIVSFSEGSAVKSEVVSDTKPVKTNERPKDDTFRILAQDIIINNNTHKTRLNNNDLIIGSTGCGKTRGYVLPNIATTEESFIACDTKSNLYNRMKQDLEARGFNVHLIDLIDLDNSTIGYNPLDLIEKDKTEGFREQQVMSLANIISPERNQKDPFWDNAARQYIELCIDYVMNFLPKNEHTFCFVEKVFSFLNEKGMEELMKEVSRKAPGCIAERRYHQVKVSQGAEKMSASILGIGFSKLNQISSKGMDRLYNRSERIDFTSLGRTKTALFINVSDVDRSMDQLVNMIYTQALQALIRSADCNKDSRLNIPVRLFLDDFACNFTIPDFDKTISVIRSREISVSVIIQCISQLEGMYDSSRAQTIINNCDTQLYLGGTDVQTAEYIAVKLNKTSNTVLNMPIDCAFLFRRGDKPKSVKRADISQYESIRFKSDERISTNRYNKIPERREII